MAPLTGEDPLRTSKEMSFLFLLFFLCISMSIFYGCNLSPTSVLHNSVFWFFVSNTLVFIIAADYGAFSPPRQKLVVYLRQEYYQTDIQTKPIVSEYQTDIQTKPIVSEIPESNHHGVFEEKENPENGLTKNVVKNDQENPNEDSPQTNTVSSEETAKNQENLVVEENKPEKVEREEMIEETDQFSKLTDEELNTRVEEFIKRFNRQIRLQNIQEKLQKSETI